MQLVETITLSSPASSLTFSSIPQDADDLLLVFAGRSDYAFSIAVGSSLRFNGDTGSNYSIRVLQGDGSAVTSSSTTSGTSMSFTRGIPKASSTSNTFSNDSAYIANYTGSTAKSVSIDTTSENNATEAYQATTAGSYSGTSAITSLSIISTGGSFVSGSTASLYKITKA